MRPVLLVAPALILTLAVTGSAVLTLALTATGLMPLVGQPQGSIDAFTAIGPDLGPGIGQSLLIAGASTALAGVTGLGIAVLIVGSRRGARLLAVAAVAPVPVAHLVGAATVGLLLSDSGLFNRLLGTDPATWPRLVAGPIPVAVVAEFAWKESAFVALVVVAAIAPALREYHEAAALLGATARQRTTMVTVPLALPALAASCLIVFLYTVGSYEVPWLLGAAHPEALPVTSYRLFSSVDLAARPQAAAAALVVTVMALAVAAAIAPLVRRLGVLR